MQSLQREYFQPIAEDFFPVIRILSDSSHRDVKMSETKEALIRRLTSQLQRDIQGMMIHSLPLHSLSKTLSFFLFDRACKLFNIDDLSEDGDDEKNRISRDHAIELQRQLHAICTGLRNVGYPQARAERAFADVVDKIIDRYISQTVKMDWHGRSVVITRLQMWIVDGLAPFTETILKFFSSTTSSPESSLTTASSQFEPHQLDMWKQLATWRLGKARVKHIFDIIPAWNRSPGPVRDLRV